MRDFGTKVVAGVTPGKAGSKIEGDPVFDRVRDAVLRRKANASILFVPAPDAKDAADEVNTMGTKPGPKLMDRIPLPESRTFLPPPRTKPGTLTGPDRPGPASPRW